MESVIISFIGGTVMLGYCILILCKYDAIKGIAIKGTMYFEDFSYEYYGKKYVSSAPRPGFNKRKGKEYRIWVNKNNPSKIHCNNFLYTMGSGLIFIVLSIFVFGRYFI